MGIKDNLKEQAKEEIKNKAKKYAKKIILKFVAPILLGIIVVAGGFMIIEGAIKDAADAVVKATSSLFSSDFDNTSDKPTVIVSDDMIKEIKHSIPEITYMSQIRRITTIKQQVYEILRDDI